MKKLAVFLGVFLVMIMININVFAKYVIEDECLVAEVEITGKIPKIELIDIKNTNLGHTNYANRTHNITVKIRVIEKNVKEENLNSNTVFLLDEKEITPKYSIKQISKTDEYIDYEINITKINGNGNLKIKIKEGAIKDVANQVNEETVFDTGIIIDNIAPVAYFSQEEIEDGKVLAKIKANEKIDEVNGWNLNSEKLELSKEFACNVTYPFEIKDYAQNSTVLDIDITKATNIKIKYGAAGAYNKWEFGYGKGDVAGKESVKANPIYKVEGMSFYEEGLDKDFIQFRPYINTYWGEGIQGSCYSYETRYIYGYNPSSDSYASLQSGNMINLDGDISLYIGGLGMNRARNAGRGGKPIPEDIANKYLFGISGLKIDLKDYSEYSIVYQIWVDGVGWQKAVSDGEETTYSHDKPIGAYRMSLIPKTEKQYLITSWNKDCGTNNMK